jgi:DNA-binding SARP family transcriptional activator
VVAPAGSGKTTLLADFAGGAGVPVAWYRAEAGDAEPLALLHALARSVDVLVGKPLREPACLEDLVADLEEFPHDRALLIVDDLHTLLDTPAETVLERLLEYVPPSVHVLLASRRAPGFNLSRLRVSGQLLELGPDELRFRSWEVEQLFRNFYQEPLPPEDMAELARRTEGWAAGLQLFHLATRGRPTVERRRLVAELGSRSRMVREYLARNVLDHLSSDLRSFLLDTCVLGRLTGPLCDELLGRSESRGTLEALEREQVFTVLIGEGGVYRYHEALRSHLELALVEQVGEAEARRRYQWAGRLLQRSGALSEALRAYCRAEAWDSVAALLGHDGRRLADGYGSWLEALPTDVRDHDPWVLLAQARRNVALGRLSEAASTYEHAARMFGSTSAADVCRREGRAVALWLQPCPDPGGDWLHLLRTATQHDPLEVALEASRLPGATGRFSAGVAALLAGQVDEAGQTLAAASELPDLPPVLGVVSRLLGTVMALAAGRPGSEKLPDLDDDVDALDLPWLTGLCRTVAVLLEAHNGGVSTPVAISDRHEGDPWGAALISLIDGALRLWDGRPAVEPFQTAALGFRSLGAGVAETWARSALALAMAGEGHPETRDVAVAAIRCARSAGVPSAEAPALLALGLVAGDAGGEYVALAQSVAAQSGLPLPLRSLASATPDADSTGTVPNGVALAGGLTGRTVGPPVTLRCFGGFVLHLGDRLLDCHRLKPRPRAALHLLALHAGRPLHREALLEALWPEVDPETGTRNLHVAISTVRRFVEPDAGRGAACLIVREGDAYRLALPEAAAVDVWAFEEGLAAGRAAQSAQDPDGAIAGLERALDAYAGELLPEAGPAEWVVLARERYRMKASEATLALCDVHLTRGDAARAVAAAERGLAIDRYRDAQWRHLITACELAGDRAAAVRARRSYEQMLAELGLAPNGAPARV